MSGRSVEFRLWGEVAAYREGERVDLGTEKEQCLFVALASEKGGPVQRDRLPDWLWDDPPDTAPAEIDRYMTRLRGRLVKAGIGNLLDNRNRQCRLNIAREQVDVHRFDALLEQARFAADGPAATLLLEAIGTSEGVPLAGLRSRKIDSYRAELLEKRFAAQLRLAGIEIRRGRYRDCVPTLVRLFAEHPEDTEVTRLTMRALHLSGRTQSALDTFITHRNHVVENEGLEVDAELGKLQRLIMDNDESLREDLASPPATHVVAVPLPPRELVVVLRVEHGDPSELRTAVARSFRREDLGVRVDADRLVCAVPGDVPHAEVLTTWLNRIAAEVTLPVQVGVAFEDEELAAELAGSDHGRRVLAAARTKNVVVVVSDEVHESVVRRWGGASEQRSYRQVDEHPGGWVRVPGYSVPPNPTREGERTRRQSAGDVVKGPTVYVQGRSRIGKQFNAAVINYGAGGSDER